MAEQMWPFIVGLIFGGLITANVEPVRKFFDTKEFARGLVEGLWKGQKMRSNINEKVSRKSKKSKGKKGDGK